jgi:radical SAM superfamily enzyme YgiQ (UPF0313 family)
MADMKRAGCEVIMWGVESFSQHVLDSVRKGIKVEDIWHTLRTAKAAGIKNWVFTMVGNYREGPEDIAITEAAMAEAYAEGLVDYRQTTVVTPMPGTELWDMAQEEGWLVAPPEGGAHMNQVYADTPWLTGQQIRDGINRIAAACPVGSN